MVTSIVLLAAFLHASWNAIIRDSNDKKWTTSILCIAMGFFAVLFIPFVPLPQSNIWVYVIVSAILHVFYNILLSSSYKYGQLSVIYPIARGTSPLLVTLGAIFLANENIRVFAVLGLLSIILGIALISLDKKHVTYKTLMISLPTALGTGVMIAAYTLVDGIGVRSSGNAISYASWMFVFTSIFTAFTYRISNGPIYLRKKGTDLSKAVVGGIGAAIAYALVIWAMQSGAMGPISSLRETSIVFAALIGRFFLSEKISFQRAMACLSITIGAILISLSH